MWFWPFRYKHSIVEAGLLKGLTDWHCHLLPGVDDGVKKMPHTLSILADLEAAGVSEVWLTPHIMEDTPNSTNALRQRFAELSQEYTGHIPLHLASENMLDNLFERRLADRDFLPLGPDGDMLLVETSYFTPPSDLDSKLTRTISAGFYPVLAHPERYMYMDRRHYARLRDRGVRFQLNLFSPTGMYGKPAAEKAAWLLKEGYYSLLGTDTHSHAQLHRAIAEKCLTPAQIKTIEGIKALNI